MSPAIALREFSAVTQGGNSSRAWKAPDLEKKDLKKTILWRTSQIEFKGKVLKRRKNLRDSVQQNPD